MGLFDSIFGGGKKAPHLTQLQLKPFTTGITDFTKQESYFPDLSRITGELNQDYQKSISGTLPSFIPNLQKAGANTTSLLAGEIPTDVGNAIARTDIAKSMAGGFGIGSGMGRNLVARDLGLTSLGLQEKGLSQLTPELAMAGALNPNVMSAFLFTPQQLLQRTDYQDVYNNGIINQQAVMDAAAKNSGGSLFSNILNGITGISSLFSGGGLGGIFSGLSSIGGLFGGGSDSSDSGGSSSSVNPFGTGLSPSSGFYSWTGI